jgi:hypothetical protein
MQRFLICLLAWITISFDVSAEPLPTKRGIFVVPGGFVPPSAYQALAQEVSRRLGDEISVSYATYLGGFPTSNATNRQLEDFYREIEKNGFRPDITVLGHSQGGLAVSNLPRGRYSRVVLMSSYVQADWTKKRQFLWDKPVLSLGGTYDPLTPPERIAYDHFLFAHRYPFTAVLLEGVNHSQFANGRKARGDLPSPLSTAEALNEIGKVIAAFIENGLESLENDLALSRSKELLHGYKQSFLQDGDACRTAQMQHLGSSHSEQFDILVQSYTAKSLYPQFILDKSYIRQSSPKPVIGIYQFTERRIGPVDVAPFQDITPEVIACKLRSADAVGAVTGESYHGRTCAEENLAIIRQTFSLLPEFRQQKLRQRGIDPLVPETRGEVAGVQETLKGQGVEVVGNFRNRGEQWALGSFLKTRRDSDGIKVETASVTTPVGDANNLFLGAYYCKLVAPSRAFQLLDEASR